MSEKVNSEKQNTKQIHVQKKLLEITNATLDMLRSNEFFLEIDDSLQYDAVKTISINKHNVKETLHSTVSSIDIQVETRSAGKPSKEQIYHKRQQAIENIRNQIIQCKKCKLAQGRTHAVPGEGVLAPLVFVIGEAPGADEDRSGRPFVGKSGQYLDTWLNAIHLNRATNIFIGNIVKCRPPHNRDPDEEECKACNDFLQRQFSVLQPKSILCLGRIAAYFLTQQWGRTIASLREEKFTYKNIPMVITYHPSAVLRNPRYRRPVWIDLQKLQKILKSIVGEY